jgi:hypothetical protein
MFAGNGNMREEDAMFRKSKKILAIAVSVCTVLSALWIEPPKAYAETNQVLLADDFEDGDATGWIATGFAVTTDGGNKVFKHTYSSGSTTRYATTGTTSWDNYAVEMKLKSGSDVNVLSMLGRYQSDDMYYAIRLDTANDVIVLSKKVNGTGTQLDSEPMTLNTNTSYTLRLEMIGDQLTGYVNGTPVLSAVDSSISTGKIGFGGYSKNSYSADDVVVVDKNPDSTPPTVPASVSAAVYQQSVAIGWSPSTDNVATVGYAVYRDGSPLTNVPVNAYTDTGLAPGTYSYQVAAYDAAGNWSSLSSAAVATVVNPVLFTDDFEDGDAAGWGAAGYAVVAEGSNHILKHTYTSGSTTTYALAGSSAWTSYSVEMKLKSGSDQNVFSMFGRYRSDETTYLMRLDTMNDMIVLSKRVNGTGTQLDSEPLTLNTNTNYTLKLEMNGDQLTGYVDGVPMLSAVDTSIKSGKIAFGGYTKNSFSADDVVVVDKRVPTRIAVNTQTAKLLESENRKFTATVYDQGDMVMNDVAASWSSDNPAIATVNNTGIITGVSEGSTIIRASYGYLTVAINVTVEKIVPVTPITGKHTLSPIAVDGVLDETVWSLDTEARKPVIGSNDNAVIFGTLWDEKYLYVGVQVMDGSLINDADGSFDDDSVEVFIDADHNHSSTYDVNDWQFRKGYDDTNVFESLGETTGVLHATEQIPGGYSAELAIPWLNLGLTPEEGLSIGFDVGVNDDDDGGEREGQLLWAGIADNFKNTLAFGDWFLSTDTVGTPVPPPTPSTGDRYVTPTGAGAMDGSSWANALPGDASGALTAAWAATGAGNTLYIGSGTYTVPQTLTLSSGGIDIQQMKKLAGVDTGGGLPVFQGDFSLTNQVNRNFIDASLGVDYWSVQDIVIRNYFNGIFANGQHEGIRIINVSVHDMSDGLYFRGRATRSNPVVGSHDIIIKGGEFTNYTKSAVRFRDGNYNASVIGVSADAGGQANYYPGNFPLAFRVGDSNQSKYIFDHDILYQDTVARNSWHQTSSSGGYYNGDGFSVEKSAYNLTYIRSKSFDHTDGGWDDKSRNPVYIDTISMGNKRNYRSWASGTATFIRVIGAYSVSRGGSGSTNGIWMGGRGTIEAYYSTFYNNHDAEIAFEESGHEVKLFQSIVGDSSGGPLYTGLSIGTVTPVDTDVYVPGVQGVDPQFVNGTNADWEGGSTDFNSQLYGATKGYSYPGPSDTPYTIQINLSSVALDAYETATVTAEVLDGNNNPVADPENIIWYSDDAYVSRLLQGRGAQAIVQGLYAGTTNLAAAYKGEEARIEVTVSP